MKCLPRILLSILVLIVLQGCAGRQKLIDPRVNFHASGVQATLMAAETREIFLKAVGTASRERLIGDDFVREAIIRGDLAKVAIDRTKAVLMIYLRSGGSREPVYSALSVMSAFLAELTAMTVPGGP